MFLEGKRWDASPLWKPSNLGPSNLMLMVQLGGSWDWQIKKCCRLGEEWALCQARGSKEIKRGRNFSNKRGFEYLQESFTRYLNIEGKLHNIS